MWCNICLFDCLFCLINICIDCGAILVLTVGWCNTCFEGGAILWCNLCYDYVIFALNVVQSFFLTVVQSLLCFDYAIFVLIVQSLF